MEEVMQIKPAEARGKFKDELLKSEGKGANWVLEPKYDGIRELLHILPGINRLTSRHISKKTGLYTDKTLNFPQLSGMGHNSEEFNIYNALKNCVFDGELLLGNNSMNATEITGSLPERAWELQDKNGWAHYKVFDILFWDGKDLRTHPYFMRRKLLEDIFTHDFGEYFTLAPTFKEDKEEALAKIWEDGGEGGILKYNMGLYGEKKNWVKIKRQLTFDVFVTGFENAIEQSTKKDGTFSETKYKGQVGSIKFGQFYQGQVVNFGQCSGFDDALRADITERKEYYLGKVFTIEAQERLPSGKFRHPRFLKFRDDKTKEACTYYPGES